MGLRFCWRSDNRDTSSRLTTLQTLVLSGEPERDDLSPSHRFRVELRELCVQVIWKYRGAKPRTLAGNTRLYDWIPQNDLLGKALEFKRRLIGSSTLTAWFSPKVTQRPGRS